MRTSVAGRTERLAAALMARFELGEAVRILNAAGILPMPLKGVLLHHLVYSDPADRMLSDADILVPTRQFREALRALRRAGYDVLPVGRAGAAARGPKARLELDVHGRVFSPGLYDLSAVQLFERGRIDEHMIDGVVVVPAPLDLYAHLVGNFVKGRHGADDTPQLRDLSAVASRFHLGAGSVAEHLRSHGLARAARYALPFAVELGDDHAGSVLRHLGVDLVGRTTAAAARALTERYGMTAHLSLLAPHLVNRTLARGAASAAAHVALGVRSRISYRLRER